MNVFAGSINRCCFLGERDCDFLSFLILFGHLIVLASLLSYDG